MKEKKKPRGRKAGSRDADKFPQTTCSDKRRLKRENDIYETNAVWSLRQWVRKHPRSVTIFSLGPVRLVLVNGRRDSEKKEQGENATRKLCECEKYAAEFPSFLHHCLSALLQNYRTRSQSAYLEHASREGREEGEGEGGGGGGEDISEAERKRKRKSGCDVGQKLRKKR
ncbi:hypothetical protein V1478_014849, partial [Vespula squamosa]